MRSWLTTSTLLLNRLLPRSCYLCRSLTETQGLLCGDCWTNLTFINAPCCHRCGLAFELDEAGGTCAACLRQAPSYDHARSVLRYDDASRPLILSFKHGDRTEAAQAFGQWLQRPAKDLIALAGENSGSGSKPLVLPVPLHWRRLFSRRYNQSALMAQALAKRLELPFRPDLLQRRRATVSQGHLSRQQRQENLRGAFQVPSNSHSAVTGAWVLLVDDVLTSGATSQACARTLKRAGAARVDLVTLARV